MSAWDDNPDWVEKDLYFDFSAASKVIKLDAGGHDGHGLSHLLKSVDFVIEWPESLWLVEVKDPEDGTIPPAHQQRNRDEFVSALQGETLITQHLFPKLRDSLIYLGMDVGILDKPLCYITLIGLTELEPAQFQGLADRLRKQQWLAGPKHRGWRKRFDVVCANVALWNRVFSNCPVTRISEQHA
ncbi:hypothetical protein WH50_11465 [Pokkaliibacter plantistimulans]|uniref:NERD domain-containing protein n=1 Tax=Pokkaliibacter plantistimulans TaxID=1635171 RepID=A0ABX5M105_9GAMM|nr:hypothetical protein [Pokkaliibacter plantistimulans]PXF31138.1 hypothetical protein WH50_11465 [Pokkaliibacter plantistimulans]